MTIKVDCILLIDDNEADNFLHRKAILKAGCAETVVAFENPLEALEALESERVRPDIIFLDINMPQMTGWEVAERYRALPDDKRHARIVVLLTTSMNPDDRERANVTTGIDGFCTKPLTPAEAIRMVEDTVRGRK